MIYVYCLLISLGTTVVVFSGIIVALRWFIRRYSGVIIGEFMRRMTRIETPPPPATATARAIDDARP